MLFPKSAIRRPRGRVFAVLAIATGALSIAAIAGCGDATRPDTWAFISTSIIEPSCATANCHSSLAARASVDLSTRQVGYTTLTTRQFVITRDAAAAAATAAMVDPPSDDDRVARSEIIHLMRADGTLRMPPDQPLPEVDIELIENWIRDGASNN